MLACRFVGVCASHRKTCSVWLNVLCCTLELVGLLHNSSTCYIVTSSRRTFKCLINRHSNIVTLLP